MSAKEHILIVDDDPGFRQTLHDILKARGYALTAVARGQTALKRAQAERPAVALIDIELPDLTGVEVLQRIKARAPATECILLTGQASQASAIEAVNLGAYGYLQKPYDVEQLLLTIRRAIEKQQTEAALRESEERFRKAFERASIGKGLASPEGRFIGANRAFYEMLGYSREEFLERTWQEVTHPDDRPQSGEYVKQLLEGDIPSFKFEHRLLHKDGRSVWVDLNVVLIEDWNGRPLYMVGDIVDITERVQAQAALASQEAELRSTLYSIGDAVIATDIEGRVARMNPVAEQLTGFAEDEAIGKPLDEVFHIVNEETRQPVGCPVARALREGVVVGLAEYTLLISKDGKELPIADAGAPIQDDEGGIVGVVLVFCDQSEERAAQNVLRESEERFRSVAQTANDAIVTIDSHGNVTYWNPRAEVMFGYAADEIVGQSLTTIMPERFREAHSEGFERVVSTGKTRVIGSTVELAGLRKDGREFPLELSLASWKTNENVFFSAVIRDITARKRTEATLQALNAAAVALQRATPNDAGVYQAVGEQLAALGLRGIITTLDQATDSFVIEYVFAAPGLIRALERLIRLKGVGARFPRARVPACAQAVASGEVVFVAGGPVELLIEALPKSLRGLAGRISEVLGPGNSVLAPLQVEGRVMGLLHVDADWLSAADMPAFTAFADQISAALENARLFEAERRRSAELTALAEVSAALREAFSAAEIMELVLARSLLALDARHGAIAVPGPEPGTLVIAQQQNWPAAMQAHVFRREGSIFGHVYHSGQPYLAEEASADPLVDPVSTAAWAAEGVGPRSAIYAPLRAAEAVTGVIALSAPAPRIFATEDLRLLVSVAEMAGNAIQRATLHEQTQRRLRRLDALRQIDMAIGASVDLRVTLNVLLDQVTLQLEVDAADVLLIRAGAHVLEYAAGRGFRSAAIAHSRLQLGEGYSGRAALERRAVVVPDLAAVDDFARAELLAGEGFVVHIAVPLLAKGEVKGVLEVFQRSPFQPDPEWLDYLETLAGQTAIAIDSATLFEGLQRSNVELSLAYDATIEGWARALDLRDRETEGHTRRVTEMTERLARALGIPDAQLVHIRRGALLHDIGKMGVPDRILNKPGPLDEAEWEVMRRHPQYAYSMLTPIAYLRPALDVPYCHHEKWDGSGYPRGLRGEQIPLAARIFSVVDVWDALRSDRPYRAAWSEDEVRAHLREQAGMHFDPDIATAFLALTEKAG